MKECNRCKKLSINIIRDFDFHDIYHCLICNYKTVIKIDECCRRPYEIVAVDNKNYNQIRLYWQCLDCGGCVNRTKPLNHKKFQEQIRCDFSNNKFNDWREKKAEENKQLWEMVKINNYNFSDYKKYIDYLSSQKWKRKRDEVLIRDNDLCQECKLKPAIEIHHITYENLYDEKLQDLVALCIECHAETHKKLNELKL
jgi:5-methylcytosine-specific restriction endonuclease McrA